MPASTPTSHPTSNPSLTLPKPTLALFYRLGKFWSIWFCCEKRQFPLYFIPLFVGKHLKEIEGLNDKGCAFRLLY